MSNYYFLSTALSPLQMGTPAEMMFTAFEQLLQTNLSAEDYAQTQVIQRFYDIQNIRAFWKEEPLDPYGSLDEIELDEALVGRQGLPDYVYDFLDRYDSVKERLHYFPLLVSEFFKQEERQAKGFLKQYLTFEREWRLVLAGFRAKQLARDITTEMQFEDPYDDLTAQILAQKDAKAYIPPENYAPLQVLFEHYYNDPLGLHKALCEYRFDHIETLLGIDLFSINRILGYMAQLILVEKWQKLDQTKGMEVVRKLVKVSE